MASSKQSPVPEGKRSVSSFERDVSATFQPVRTKCDTLNMTVFDTWGADVPVMRDEIDVLEAYFGGLLDELLRRKK